ncbi:GL23507 [Drosophila persimilis]|uniref:GL23507 n=1 Tax=Drosophila persimilis TaxID=7234 RepID=B4G323_DROPE|nr:GL23507 [Drosophila persimilis]
MGMGTLAQPMAKPKVNIKGVKRLVAGKSKDFTKDLGEDIDANMLEPQATSKPQMLCKGKATRKQRRLKFINTPNQKMNTRALLYGLDFDDVDHQNLDLIKHLQPSKNQKSEEEAATAIGFHLQPLASS